ncbi:hypothetical protein J5N97_013207 [Dioscorea zingiberensis]|uniref:Glycolipid transfer protein domain-containing protein n=1 Tax=Dioscorea zingiberensis TaxID=325984 RepID=A0A9D5HIK8_9LILI|nr:hypothetical protein J5N97_013207 [Dioscorea zingiberensis]
MDFLVELFRNLLEHQDWTMSQAGTDSCGKTLKKWHGWLASSSFTLAMKLAPDRNKLVERLVAKYNSDQAKVFNGLHRLKQRLRLPPLPISSPLQ